MLSESELESELQVGWRRPIAPLLYLLGIMSACVGGWNAAMRSQDCQWSGVRMLLDKIDPWLDFLQGDPLHRILLIQNPNYLPILYVLIAPLGLFPWSIAKLVWLACNVIFATWAAVLACRFYGLRRKLVPITIALFFMSTPLRTALGNGQQGIMVTFIWCLTLLSPALTTWRASTGGISYFKFNFAPPLFLYLLFKGGLRPVLLSGIFPAIGTAIVWLWLTGGKDLAAIPRLIMEPIAVSRTGYYPRTGGMNFMDVLDPAFLKLGLSVPHADSLETILGVLVCALVFYFAIRKHLLAPAQYHMAILGTAAFMLFRHHSYDAVCVLFPLCFALRMWEHQKAKIMLAIIAYLFYIQRAIEATHILDLYLYIPSFGLFVWLLYLTYELRDAKAWPASTVRG